MELSELQKTAAKLYGQGFERKQIAAALVDHLQPDDGETPRPKRLHRARSQLRKWEGTKKFRDLVYSQAVIKMDMQTPGILQGITHAAKRGRVDAARLALEVAGRHSSQGNAQVTAVQVNIANGIPRPGGSA
jgi:hypothetical protein